MALRITDADGIKFHVLFFIRSFESFVVKRSPR
jgi:hypothetical protein